MPEPLPLPGRYIDPLIDFAFKKIFGSEPNKDLLIDFLNQVLRGRKVIMELTYGKTEYPGNSTTEGGFMFDLMCAGPDGEQFIIEMQRGSQQYFKERALYYTSRLISSQVTKVKRKEWNYELKEIYLVALLKKSSLSQEVPGQYIYDICLCNRDTGVVFYDKLNYTYIELRHFIKTADELQTDLDHWLFVLKHLSSMDKLPAYLRKPIFTKLFQIAEYNNMTKQERLQYDRNQMHHWDNKNVIDFAIKEAVEKTTAEKDKEKVQEVRTIAANLKKIGLPVKNIAAATGLSIEEIEEL